MNRRSHDRTVKIGLVAVVFGVAAVIVASATLGANEPAAPSAEPPNIAKPGRPTVMLADENPLRVRGTQFKAGERVRVTVDDGSGPTRKLVTAGKTGGFVVSFAGVEVCSLTVSASGDKGSRTSFQLSSFRC